MSKVSPLPRSLSPGQEQYLLQVTAGESFLEIAFVRHQLFCWVCCKEGRSLTPGSQHVWVGWVEVLGQDGGRQGERTGETNHQVRHATGHLWLQASPLSLAQFDLGRFGDVCVTDSMLIRYLSGKNQGGCLLGLLKQ